MTTSDAQKRRVAEKLMRLGTFVLSVDPKQAGQSLPARFHDQTHLDVRVSRAHVVLTDGGITGRVALLNSDELIAVDIRWRAVFGMTSDADPSEGKVWPRSFPPKMLNQIVATSPHGRRRMDSGVRSNVVDLSAYRARKAAGK